MAGVTDVAKAKKLQTPSGANAKPEVAAATNGAAEAKDVGSKAPASADPAGAESASAAPSEQSRDAADVTAPDRKAVADEGKQPEETHQPPVADEFGIDGKTLPLRVRSARPGGRRRAGFAFGPDAIELDADDLDEAAVRAILADPQLIVEIV